MKAVITVIGKDKIGIIALVSGECERFGVNILEISQTVMSDYFTMIMVVEIGKITKDGSEVSFSAFSDELSEVGRAHGVEIRVMHEDIFNSMHTI